MKYLLDRNVVSEPIRARPSGPVLAGIEALRRRRWRSKGGLDKARFRRPCAELKEKLIIRHPWQKSARDSKTRFPNRFIFSRLSD
jgi:hypothetical protein